MSLRQTTSASDLYYELVGDDFDFYDDEQLHHEDFLAEQERILLADAENRPRNRRERRNRVANPSPQFLGRKGEKPKGSIATVKLQYAATTQNDVECSVCYELFADKPSLELRCGHKFCCACLTSYAEFHVAENFPLHFNVSDASVERDGDGFSILVVQRADYNGVPCPNRACGRIVRDEVLKEFLPLASFQRFEKVLAAQLERLRDMRFKDLALRLDNAFFHWSTGNSSLVRLCPHCFVQIEKNGGCHNMDCTTCGRHFVWEEAIAVNCVVKKHWLSAVKERIQGKGDRKK